MGAVQVAADLQDAVHAYDGPLSVAVDLNQTGGTLVALHVSDSRISGTLTLVPLTLDELASLRRDSERLAKLEAAGVDNWEGYSNAFREED